MPFPKTGAFDALLSGGLPQQQIDPEDIVRILGMLSLYYRHKNQPETKQLIWEATDIYEIELLENILSANQAIAAVIKQRIHSKQDLIRKTREANKLRAQQKAANKKVRSDS